MYISITKCSTRQTTHYVWYLSCAASINNTKNLELLVHFNFLIGSFISIIDIPSYSNYKSQKLLSYRASFTDSFYYKAYIFTNRFSYNILSPLNS